MKITDQNYAVPEGDTHFGKWVEQHQRLDFDQSALGQYLPLFPEKGVLINVGANIGCYAYAFLKKASEVICFEPNPPVFECLRHNLGNFSNTKLFNEAISDSIRPFEMGECDGNFGAVPIVHKNNSATKTNYIDNFNFKSIDFMLIDAEGSELNILKGAVKSINKFKPIIVMEINTHLLERLKATKEDIFNFLENQKYSYRNIYKGRPLTGPQDDIICTPL